MKAQRVVQGVLPRQPSFHSLVNAGEKQVTHMLAMRHRKGPRKGRLLAEASMGPKGEPLGQPHSSAITRKI